mmetsp:Transcript_26990/g.37676  ORF Transcript_26990/g.37676 Transcript_26990/m.37676 type:complete len:129 (+) Transcript_26990:37-423(+)|eukprot:CAMPEP_0185254572 /NCGR_PEP_ID=MMETSP1359-20130426/3431_1 /TAXON_ID=552665 /ORGANISM="Bigelowiella longifila, Strain CCMP242" /LENGTH=128 /DNA_ID=CAMNT_0027837749 /DNA_START=23 /DNA_END=409 /DNA_ORIENTATION=-
MTTTASRSSLPCSGGSQILTTQRAPQATTQIVHKLSPKDSGSNDQKEKKVKGIYKSPGAFEKAKENGGKQDKGIEWTKDTVDNEFLNKKSSKICCVYHKPRRFDESDSDESDYEKPQTYNPNQPHSIK